MNQQTILKPVISSRHRSYVFQKRITEKKFKEWDNVVELNYLEGTDEQRARVYDLLDDPTIYVYAFFRDKHNKPLKLYAYQDMMINDESKRIIFTAANQIGKSLALCCKGLHFALTKPGTTTLMGSKTMPQAKDLLRQIVTLLKSSTVEYKADIGDTQNKTEIYFKHFEIVDEWDEDKKEFISIRKELPQSRIIVVPATDAALGYPADLILLDELGFFKDGRYVYFQIFQPRTYETKGQIIVFSNPNGQQGVFWELWNDDEFSRYCFNYLDKPGNTQEDYDKLQKKLTRDEFDSTVRAVFTSPEGGFISLAERKAMQDKDRSNMLPTILTEPIFIFYDFAKIRDRTVRSSGIPIGTETNRGIHVYEMYEYDQDTPYNIIVDDLKELIKLIGIEMIGAVGWDNTGVGKGVEDFINQIEMLGIECIPIEFSLQNKSRIYTIFKLLIEKNLRKHENGITIPYVEECDAQLSKLMFKKTGREYLKVHHETEKDRDDFPDSLAGLSAMVIDPDYTPVTLKIY